MSGYKTYVASALAAALYIAKLFKPDLAGEWDTVYNSVNAAFVALSAIFLRQAVAKVEPPVKG